MYIKRFFLIIISFSAFSFQFFSQKNQLDLISSISLKTPGNASINYQLNEVDQGNKIFLTSDENIPVIITRKWDGYKLNMFIVAQEDVHFNLKHQINSEYAYNDCLFYLPGFWYRHNLRSPKEAPSFHVSDSWSVREDRLSTPMTGIFNKKIGEYMSVIRLDSFKNEALTTHKEGEVVLSGKTSIGYTGFENINGNANFSFGFPFQETPKTYLRKLTLAPPVEAFQYLKKGEAIELVWQIKQERASDFSDFIKQMWEYSYDTFSPQPVKSHFTDAFVKETLTDYFYQSFVDENHLKYNAGVGLKVSKSELNGIAEIGFIGRVLLNAFYALEYGEENNLQKLVDNSYSIFESYLQNGFTKTGLFRESVNFDNNTELDIYSIRRQSEGVYAILHFLKHEKDNGRKHPKWEEKIKVVLNNFLLIQNKDGSFPRKFDKYNVLIDASGGSTPSATLPLVMGYKYFNNIEYLNAAKKTAEYLENEIISKADYFSSTLDANCEDKEASLYAATANYYLALITEGEEQEHYAELCRKASYFALSWYYTWDVPFTQGQMLGDIGFKTRGWGNVSVENNHIDVFVFEFASVLDWLAERCDEPRFTKFTEVIRTSMRQLLPYEGHLCGVGKAGYYPEVVQHTNWDYGKNGKGYYNDVFAPGWTVASLWELLSPRRAEKFLK